MSKNNTDITNKTDDRKERSNQKAPIMEYPYPSVAPGYGDTLVVGRAYLQDDGTNRILTLEDIEMLRPFDDMDTASRWHLYGMINIQTELYKEEACGCFKRGASGELITLPAACPYDPEEIVIRREEQEAKLPKKKEFKRKKELAAKRVLSEKDYNMYQLWDTEGLKMEVIGNLLNVDKSTVSRHVNDAYKKIVRELLKEYSEDEILDILH